MLAPATQRSAPCEEFNACISQSRSGEEGGGAALCIIGHTLLYAQVIVVLSYSERASLTLAFS